MLARAGGSVVLTSLDGNGRFVLTGSNFMLDNWALMGKYKSSDNDVLALQIVQWICGVI